ncbi:hypothetical protein TPHV1_20202 [Treponema phagedenis]|uniref:Uncharacterized protein n=1 Tax=Treponema phagedenis TaxID=162 RepID=A0A0B7GXJ8_TREPH|nr:hypothetical protein TPHV1_20202 [Treponema phagedenis]
MSIIKVYDFIGSCQRIENNFPIMDSFYPLRIKILEKTVFMPY